MFNIFLVDELSSRSTVDEGKGFDVFFVLFDQNRQRDGIVAYSGMYRVNVRY